MRHQGNELFSYCAPLLDPPLPKGLGTILTPKSGILFKNLVVRIYMVETWTEINMGASAAMLSCVQHGHWPLVREAQGAPPILATGFKTSSSSELSF